MLYTPHFLVGAAILKYVPNPMIGVPLAIVSHVILDLTPHNDFDIKPGVTIRDLWIHDKRKRNIILAALSVDWFLMGISATWLLLSFHTWWLITGGIAGILPDLLEQSLLLFGFKLPGIQDKFQWRVPAKYGFISYPIVSLIALYLLKR